MKHLKLVLTLCLLGQVLLAQRPAPGEAHRDWHETEFYLFFHFGPNTFTDLEWGHGTEAETIFNPDRLDCEQWCRIAKAAGAKGVIITAKHHDGFCLWPSNYSRHTVRESPWKAGQGDVLKELAAACKKYELKFGVYLSPWDRNHPQYGTPEYNNIYAGALIELLTGYGELFEIWWDGANGEGPNGKKQTYDFHRFEKLVKKYQPNAIIFSDIGPGCRWAGNEQGTVAETNWCTMDTIGYGRGATGPPAEILQHGQENGALWIPAECDVSIRPGWFYHAAEDSLVKTPEQLFQIYLQSVGRGANLILNVPPNPHGLIAPADSASLLQFGKLLEQQFSENLALQASATIKGPYRPLPARQLNDGNDDTFLLLKKQWPHLEPGEVTIDFGKEVEISCVRIKEALKKTGQRVKSFSVEVSSSNGDEWREIARSTTIGPRKILKFPAVSTQQLRIKIIDTLEYAVLSEIEVYR